MYSNYAKRGKDVDWAPCDEAGTAATWAQVQAAILMDIRDELKKLNALAHCHNTIAIPALLKRIAKNTTKPKRRKK